MDNINGWFGSLRWRYFGSRALVEDNTVRSRATSLLNGRIGYIITNKIRAYLDVFNSFNWRYHDIDYFYVSASRTNRRRAWPTGTSIRSRAARSVSA